MSARPNREGASAAASNRNGKRALRSVAGRPRALAKPGTNAVPPPPDPESRLSGDHHESLRLWLRLMTCTLLIERRIRARLREDFATTLPRFDLMAQLERNPDGLKMGELSRRLMVTGGNVTGITDQLVAEKLVERAPFANDRRAYAVRLTPKGKRAFDAMAAAHERWVIDLLSGLDTSERRRLCALLDRIKTTVRGSEAALTEEHTR
jgi:DNA-binding MarR family transcriptional regulator